MSHPEYLFVDNVGLEPYYCTLQWKLIVLFLNLNCLFALKVCQDLSVLRKRINLYAHAHAHIHTYIF